MASREGAMGSIPTRIQFPYISFYFCYCVYLSVKNLCGLLDPKYSFVCIHTIIHDPLSSEWYTTNFFIYSVIHRSLCDRCFGPIWYWWEAGLENFSQHFFEKQPNPIFFLVPNLLWQIAIWPKNTLKNHNSFRKKQKRR